MLSTLAQRLAGATAHRTTLKSAVWSQRASITHAAKTAYNSATIPEIYEEPERILAPAFKGQTGYFPCVDREQNRNKEAGGPNPRFSEVAFGYNLFHIDKPFYCEYGGVLPEAHIAYETWGTMNSDRSNVVLLHTGLSASSHAHSTASNPNPGWWEKFIGPGKAVDTDKFFVICTNVLGSCYGSTGPSSINPITGKPFATTFPLITIKDMVKAQFQLMDYLGIERLHASMGASMGGMQSLCAAHEHPERVSRVICMSGAARSHPYSIALRHIQRRVLMSDPNWNNGNYYDGNFPHVGMKHSREIAFISYRSGPEWEERFGRKRADMTVPPSFCPDFLIETYLDKQGEAWCLKYDPNSMIYLSKAMDIFDLGAGYSDLSESLSRVDMPALVIGVQSDILFPVWQQAEIAKNLKLGGNKKVRYYELDAMYGHDTFLIDEINIGAAVKGHLEHDL
eukprot:Clim_evm23s14 gene=Clim_evmTU23s14